MAFFYYQSAAGLLKVFEKDGFTYSATFVEEDIQVATQKTIKNMEFYLQGTEFQKKVWHALLKIPTGKTISYQDLARSIGKPKAVRAVANAVGANPVVYFIPCHRVIRKNGELGGFSAGIMRKRALLKAEKVII